MMKVFSALAYRAIVLNAVESGNFRPESDELGSFQDQHRQLQFTNISTNNLPDSTQRVLEAVKTNYDPTVKQFPFFNTNEIPSEGPSDYPDQVMQLTNP